MITVESINVTIIDKGRPLSDGEFPSIRVVYIHWKDGVGIDHTFSNRDGDVPYPTIVHWRDLQDKILEEGHIEVETPGLDEVRLINGGGEMPNNVRVVPANMPEFMLTPDGQK